MEEDPDEPADRLLRDAWTQWANLVAAICGKAVVRELETKHSTAACTKVCSPPASSEAGSAGQHTLFRRLLGMLEPWVSLESLERTEPELLGKSAGPVPAVDANLGIRRPLRWIGRMAPHLPQQYILIIWILLQAGAAAWRLLSSGAGGSNGLSLSSVLHSLQLDSLPGQACVLLPLMFLMAVAN